MPRSNKKPKHLRRYLEGAPLVARWIVCQDIAKILHRSSLIDEQIQILHDELYNDQRPKLQMPIIKLK